MKNIKIPSTLFLFLLGAICLMSFQKEESVFDSKVEIEKKVAQNLAKFKKNKQKRCQEKLLKEANRMVDSILITRAKLEKRDTSIHKPPKPDKPIKPEIIVPIDSTPVKPLIEVPVQVPEQ